MGWMMIYRIAKDGYKFKEPDFTADTIVKNFPHKISYFDAHHFPRKNIELGSWWQKIAFEFEDVEGMPSGQVPDICIWDGATFVLSEAVFKALGNIMEPCGEFLELDNEGKLYYLFNCLATFDADECQSDIEWFEGEVFDVRKLVFDDNAPAIFKSRHGLYLDAFCQESFKRKVEELKFKGIIFSETLVSNL